MIQLSVPIRVRDPVESTINLALIIIHSHVKSIKRPQNPVYGANVDRYFFNRSRIQRLPLCRSLKLIKSAILITGDDPPFSIHTQIHPGTLLSSRDGINQFHFKALRSFDPGYWSGLVFILWNRLRQKRRAVNQTEQRQTRRQFVDEHIRFHKDAIIQPQIERIGNLEKSLIRSSTNQ